MPRPPDELLVGPPGPCMCPSCCAGNTVFEPTAVGGLFFDHVREEPPCGEPDCLLCSAHTQWVPEPPPSNRRCVRCGSPDCPGGNDRNLWSSSCTRCTYCAASGGPVRHEDCSDCGRCRAFCHGQRCGECLNCYCNGPCDECGECSCYGSCDVCGECGCSGPCEYCDGCGCGGDCDDHPDNRNGHIHHYGYKPEPVFHGAGPLFMGLELEIETPLMNKALSLVTDGFGDLAYVKEDSSIRRGFEIVTHPMDWSYVDSRFPWKVLPDLREAGAYANPDENGIHVHLSRQGFSGPCHVFRWMKLLHRNRNAVINLARRESSQWAAWHRSTRRMTKYLVKPGLVDNRYLPRPERQSLMYGDGRSRYEAINITNSATFELRMFASSLEEQEVAAALAFASSSVEYTRILTPQDILKNDGWSWRAYSDFVSQTPSYAPLRKEIDKLCAY